MLTDYQRQSLIEAANPTREDMTKENPVLELAIKTLKEKHPEHFHSDRSLEERCFYHHPSSNVAYKSCVTHRKAY